MGYTVYITANRYYEVHIKDAKEYRRCNAAGSGKV